MNLIKTAIALEVGRKVLSEVGEPEPLEGVYLDLYSEYVERIEKDEQYIRTEWNDDKNAQTAALDELDTEKLHCECVFRFLQEKRVTLLKEEKDG